MIEKLEDFPQNADTQKLISKINELVSVINHKDVPKAKDKPKPKK